MGRARSGSCIEAAASATPDLFRQRFRCAPQEGGNSPEKFWPCARHSALGRPARAPGMPGTARVQSARTAESPALKPAPLAWKQVNRTGRERVARSTTSSGSIPRQRRPPLRRHRGEEASILYDHPERFRVIPRIGTPAPEHAQSSTRSCGGAVDVLVRGSPRAERGRSTRASRRFEDSRGCGASPRSKAALGSYALELERTPYLTRGPCARAARCRRHDRR